MERDCPLVLHGVYEVVSAQVREGDIDVSHPKQSRRQISVHDSSQLGETGKALLDETQLRPVISWRRYESGGGDCEIGTAQQSVDVTSQRKRRDKRGGSARSSGCPVSNISIAFFIWVSPGSGIETPRLGGGRAKSGHGTVLGLAKLGNLRLVLGTGSLIGDIATAPRFWGTRYALAPTTETHSQWNWCPQSCCFPHCRGLSLIYVLLRGFTSRAQGAIMLRSPHLVTKRYKVSIYLPTYLFAPKAQPIGDGAETGSRDKTECIMAPVLSTFCASLGFPSERS